LDMYSDKESIKDSSSSDLSINPENKNQNKNNKEL